MNDKTELLTWAVENITEWNDDYTHLRSDASRYPFYTRDGKYGWLPDRVCKLAWASDDNNGFSSVYKELAKDFSTNTLQVITKQEYIDAVNASKTSSEPLQGHIHANLMAEYAIVDKTNPEPWKEFEWFDGHLDLWKPLNRNPGFYADTLYRRKPSPPKTMTIGYIVVEACPLKEMKVWQEFYEITQHFGEYVVLDIDNWRYAEDTFKDRALKAGYIFATQQEAQAVADALNSIYKKAVDEAWKS